MKLALLTPGTGGYHCGVCMRDNAMAREWIRMGHDALMLPMYLPLTLDEVPTSAGGRIFFGGVNVYLQQKFALFRHTPRWLDAVWNHPSLLRAVGRFAGATGGAEIGELTHSMLLGSDGKQRKEVEGVINFLRLEKPDAIWLSTALLAGLAGPLAKALGVPVFGSLQGEDAFLDTLAEPWRTRCWELLGERARDARRWVAPSRYFAELMRGRLRLPAEAIEVIPNGIDPAGYVPALAAPDPPVIGYLARFIPGKGLGLVIDAFIELRKRMPDVRLRCAGTMTAADERYLLTQQEKVRAAGLEEAVDFLPNVSREVKGEFLRGLTLFSVPATYGEAFGLYLVEAWAAGVPVVQPRHAAFPELIEATGAGVLCEPNDPVALALAWEGMLANPARAKEMGMLGRAAVEGKFGLRRMAERFLEVSRG